MRQLKIEGDRFAEVIQVELDKYEVEVGILADKTVYEPIHGESQSYAGLRLAAVGRKISGSLVDIAHQLNKRFHWLERPWRLEENQDVQQVVNDIIESINMNNSGKQRVLNGMQAIIRNPILGDYYGKNSARWAKIKGFNKLLMYTGQFFQNIKARYVS